MKNNYYKIQNLFAACSLIGTPTVKFNDVINYVVCVINSSILPFILALSVTIFAYGVVQYIIGAGEETKREKGRQFMIWGVIALTCMVSLWGLVRIVNNTFGIVHVIPQVQNNSN